ncbi:hypothetical protein [Companilactobacillus musae]|nr:hypothetical protein [Companilactobacillus musae]
MFAYVQIINQNTGIKYGYVQFKFTKGMLKISALKGLTKSDAISIPITEISTIQEDNYYGWNRIKFNYKDIQYIFLYSGYGEFDYLRENISEPVIA